MEERTFETPNGLTLEIRIPAGQIRVRTAETTVASVRVDGERADDVIDITSTTLPDGGTRVIVECRSKRSFGFLGLGRDLDVTADVPVGTKLTVDSGSADLRTSGTLGAIAFRTGSGDCAFDEVTGDLTIKAASGDLKGRAVGGDLTSHGASGEVDVASVGGDVVVRTASGDLRLGLAGGSVQVTSVSGDIEIGSVRAGVVNARSVSGDVELGVAAGTGVFLDVSSTSGDVRSDLDAVAGTDDDAADLQLTAASVSGDIRIRRAAARPVTEV